MSEAITRATAFAVADAITLFAMDPAACAAIATRTGPMLIDLRLDPEKIEM